MKLGRKAVKTDSRTLRLATYLPAVLPTLPTSVDWTKGITSWGEMLNNSLGCCTIAGVAHAVQVWSANAGSEITVPDSTVLAYYEQWDGYISGDASTDNGSIEIDVLNNWKSSSFAGHKLLGYADPAVHNMTEVEQGINLFGGLYIGFLVPRSVMNNASNPSVVWDVHGDNSIVGGHCVFVTGYDADTISCISWGQVYRMTRKFWSKFVDEAHALLSQDFIAANGLDPQGFNLAQLQADLSAIV